MNNLKPPLESGATNEDQKLPVVALRGNLDQFNNFVLVGWAISADGEPVELQLRVNGVTIDCQPIQRHRLDVINTMGTTNPNVGFEIGLPASIWGKLAGSGGRFEITGNGVSLTPEPIELAQAMAVGWIEDIIRMGDGPEKQFLLYLALQHIRHGKLLPRLTLSDAHFMRQYSLQAGYQIEGVDDTPSGSATTGKSDSGPDPKRSYFDRMDKFTLAGWAINDHDEPADVQVQVNGKILDCTIIRQERQDVRDALGITSLNVGFLFELPGYIWEELPEDGGKVGILVNGTELAIEPLTLDRATAKKWISKIFAMEEGQERQYLALLALEHIRYGNFLPELAANDARAIRDFAQRMQLENFIHPKGVYPAAPDVAVAPAESMTKLLIWRALRALNARLTDDALPAFNQVKAVISDLRLQGEVNELFLRSVTPLMCKTGEFLRLRELIEFNRLQQLAAADGLWEMTLSVPALIADGHVDRATDTVYRSTQNLGKGWFNTECIPFSIQLVQRLELDGKIEIAVAEKFRYAVIALLDAFNGEWFSRLHDQNLIDSMLLLLSELDRYTDYHRRDVVAAAQRLYGLNPTFWKRATNRQLPLQNLDSGLALSHAYFEKLYRAFTVERPSPADWLEEIAEPLAYNRARNNPEAVIFLREICANLLPDLNEPLPNRAKALLAKLLAADPAEALRIAAFPLAAENRLLEMFPETRPEMLRETLRNLSEPAKSVAWHLQEHASAALHTLLKTEHADRQRMAQALSALEQRATTLANWQGSFLAFDLLASGYAVASGHGMECSPLLVQMLGILDKAVAESKVDFFPPAPVLAGLIRLGGVGTTDPLLKGFLADCRSMIRGKFGERMDDGLFALPEQPQLSLKPSGWPQDTLVVIYSCRKYLDTRVKAIRETWAHDLMERGIPYLVLVGDGDNSIAGDVLALDVSDKYEDLPKKSLKLFEWVYHNTDVQYVLKIDDDCYLDAARFFDTLSYRKHHYYGRVIQRGIGSMDRIWHQTKSHTSHSRKSIDKSPEPSVYADGGGGYTLSRLAMQQLLQAEKTQQGEHLKACSFMEDKLVGDLLALRHILPSDEDYDSYQRRRTFAEAMPVGMIENNFFPCLATPTKVTHLDTEVDFGPVHDRATSKELWPKKLWPTCWSPSIKHNSNQLELVSDLDKVAALMRHGLQVITVVRNEMIMLPAFLAHYRRLGIKSFVIVDNCSDDGTREYLFGQPDVVLYSADTEYKHSHYGVAWQQAVLGNFCLNKWALLVDADELLVYEGHETKSLHDFVAEVDAEGADAVRTDMIDMYPYGDLEAADFSETDPFIAAPWFDNPPLTAWRLGSGMFSNGTTYLSRLRHRLADSSAPNAFTSQKYGLIRYRPWVRYSQGLHDVANVRVSGQRAWFAHFKYHAGFKNKVETEIRRGQHFNNAEEYRRYASMLAEGQGGFGREGISVKYTGVSSIAENC